MRIHLIAVGNRMPDWVEQGYREYAGRLTQEVILELVEISPHKRSKSSDLERIRREEGEQVIAAIPRGCLVIALEVTGKSWSTEQLARQMDGWLQGGRDVALLVGGPEGLSDACRERADLKWSLSPLTLPHPMVRVLLAEQLYRAWSILKNHPYHR